MAKIPEGQKMTRRQEVFVSEYLNCLNAAEAARRAGYSKIGARQHAYHVLQIPSVQDAIEVGMKNLHPSVSSEFEKLVNRKNNPSIYVYLIRSDNGLTKIGVTRDIGTRVSTLNTASPVELRLLFYFAPQNAKLAEANLHKRFFRKRVKGEWFNLTDMDVSWVKNNYDIIEEAHKQPCLF